MCRLHRMARALAVMVLVLCLSPSAATAQVGSGAITGTVVDAQGAAVPGATVTVTSTATGRRRVLVSNQDGVFAATALTPGEYSVDAALAGFKPVSVSAVRIATGETARVEVRL